MQGVSHVNARIGFDESRYAGRPHCWPGMDPAPGPSLAGQYTVFNRHDFCCPRRQIMRSFNLSLGPLNPIILRMTALMKLHHWRMLLCAAMAGKANLAAQIVRRGIQQENGSGGGFTLFKVLQDVDEGTR